MRSIFICALLCIAFVSALPTHDETAELLRSEDPFRAPREAEEEQTASRIVVKSEGEEEALHTQPLSEEPEPLRATKREEEEAEPLRATNDKHDEEAEALKTEEPKTEEEPLRATNDKHDEEAEPLKSSVETEKPREKRASKVVEVVKTEKVVEVVNATAPLNPCDMPEFRYYIENPSGNKTSYIECNPWGTFEEHVCEEGKEFDEWSVRCMHKDATYVALVAKAATMPIETINCTLPEFSCLNGGMCVQDIKCMCNGTFTGEFCETEVEVSELYVRLMSDSFSIKDYTQWLISENLTSRPSFFDHWESRVEPSVWSKVVEYLSHFKEGTLRYDTVMSELVENIIEDIYPDANYLREFRGTPRSWITIVHMIPNLHSYAKYSLSRFDDILFQYERVLDKVIKALNTTVIQKQAVEYMNLIETFGNKSVKIMWNKTVEHKHPHPMHAAFNPMGLVLPANYSDVIAKEHMRALFNTTLNQTRTLFKSYSHFLKDLIVSADSVKPTFNWTAEVLKFAARNETITMLHDIQVSTWKLWCKVHKYGMWYLTSVFVEPSFVHPVNATIAARLAIPVLPVHPAKMLKTTTIVVSEKKI